MHYTNNTIAINIVDQSPSTRPISFVVVHCTDEFKYNYTISETESNEFNELIVIDNAHNIFFDNLSDAVEEGIKRANNEIIVIVDEAVVLPRGWQARFEKGLDLIEADDKTWGVLGCPCVNAWDWKNQERAEYISGGNPVEYKLVEKLEDHLLILQKSTLPKLDTLLPGNQLLGISLVKSCKKEGRAAYLIDAPCLYKYANKTGSRIENPHDLEMTLDHNGYTYRAERNCCNEYMSIEDQQAHIPNASVQTRKNGIKRRAKEDQLASPVLLLGRGGGGTRLLGTLASDAGLFIGNELNKSMDSIDMVMAVYQGIIRKFRCRSSRQKMRTVEHLRSSAAQMIADLPENAVWGFKLPESLLLLPELAEAFPKARYISYMRDPLAICLRRTHLTARLDNHIGRITLPLAYDYLGIDRRRILLDSPGLHMAYTTVHQLELLIGFLSQMEQEKIHRIRFEHLIDNPLGELGELCDWLNIKHRSAIVESLVDRNRAVDATHTYSADIEWNVEEILRNIRQKTAYL